MNMITIFSIWVCIAGRPILPMYMAPAVTPVNSTVPGVGANNPGIRLYKYSRETGHILDFVQFYLDLPEANIKKQADWSVEYAATKAYGINDIGAEALDSLVKTFKEPSSKNFQKYFLYTMVSCDSTAECSEDCKQQHICGITCIDYDQFDECIQKPATTPVKNTDHGETLKFIPQEPANPELVEPRLHDWYPLPDHSDTPCYTYYIIWVLTVFIVILFVVLVTMCFCRRTSRVATKPRYALVVDYN